MGPSLIAIHVAGYPYALNRHLCERSDPTIFRNVNESRTWSHASVVDKEQWNSQDTFIIKATAICAKSCKWFAGTERSREAELHMAQEHECKCQKELGAHTRAG